MKTFKIKLRQKNSNLISEFEEDKTLIVLFWKHA